MGIINKKQFLATTVSLAIAFIPAFANANPTGGSVVEGAATITNVDAQTTVINQQSQKAILEWQDFSIGNGETTRFEQPNSSSVALNRVTGQNPSEILGNLQANGQVFLVNPNGVMFGVNSRVDVGGLVATTSNVTNNAFNNAIDNLDLMDFDQAGLNTASVVNNGNIAVTDGGLVALVAPNVNNNGNIVAKVGKVALAGGETFTLDLYGDSLVKLASNKTLDASLAKNSGTIEAHGGYVALTAGQAKNALDNIVNMDGVIHANTVDDSNGRIILSSDNGLTTVNGEMIANQVEVLGELVALYEDTDINADAQNGGGIIHVGGDFKGADGTQTAKNTFVASGAKLSADALQNGDGGEVVVWADGTTGFLGNISAKGGQLSGNGGMVEVSGKDTLIFRGDVNTSAPNGEVGTLLLDPVNIVIADGAGGVDDAQVSDGIILQADGGGGDFTISEQALEALSAGTNINLEASNNITINDLTDDDLNLATTGSVIFWADNDSSGAGDFIMNSSDKITTVGSTVTINGYNITVAEIDTSSGSNGNVTFTSTLGSTLYGDITTNDGNLFINGPSTLGANVNYSTGAGSGNLNLNSTLSGDFTFGLATGTSGNIVLLDTDIDTLNLTSGNSLSLNGDLLTDTALNLSALSTISLLGNSTVTAQDGAVQNVTFGLADTINGNFTFGVTGDTVTLPLIGDSTPLASLTVNGTTAISLLNNITTAGLQDYTGAVSTNGNLTTTNSNITITGDTIVGTSVNFSTGGAGLGNLTLTGALDGGFNVSLDAGTGAVSVGAVGAITPLGQLVADGASLAFSGGVITTGLQTYSDPATIAGNFTSSNNDITFSNATTLSGNTAIDTGAGAGDILFNNTLNGAFTFSADSGTGSNTFTGAVGGSSPLTSFAITGDTILSSNVNTTGTQTYTGDLDSSGNLTASAGALTVVGDVTLSAGNAWTTGGGASDNVTLSGSGNVSGDNTLSITAGGGDVTLGTVDVDTLTLVSADDMTLNGNITTDTAQNYTNVDDITLAGNTTFTADNAGTKADITFDNGNTIAAAGTLTLDGATVTTFDTTGLTALTITGDTAINLGGTNTFASLGNVNLVAPIIATNAITGINQFAATGATSVALNNDISADGTITINGGTTTMGGNLTTTNDDITINTAVNLTGDSIISTGAGIGDVSFGSTIDGAQALTVSTGTGDFSAAGNIGAVTPLTSLTVNATNLLMANVTTSDFQDFTGNVTNSGLLSAGNAVNMTGNVILGGGVTTSNGDININGTVTLSADSILQSGGTIADTINITGDIGGDYQLDFAAGSANIALGGTMDIDEWLMTSGSQLTLGGTFTTDQAMDFTNIGNIVMTADTIITANDGGSSLQNITMDAANIFTGPYNLTMNGDNVIMGGVGTGGVTDPLSFTINSNSFSLLGAIFTVGGQNYSSIDGLGNNLTTQGADIDINTDLNLVGDVALSTGAGGGNITFGGAVDGAFALSANTGTGDLITSDDFGSTTPLTSLTLIGQDFTLFNVTTTGDQAYTGTVAMNGDLTTDGGSITFNDAVTLAQNVTVDNGSGGGEINFNDTVDGPFDFTVVGGTADINFDGVVGGITRLGTLTINTAADLIFTNGVKVTSFVETSGTGQTVFGTNPGLDTLEGITISAPSFISGRITGGNTILESTGTMDVIVDVASLAIGGQSSHIVGKVGGKEGRDAAQITTFTQLSSGPHLINGYNIPLLDTITAPQVLNGSYLPGVDSITPNVININATRTARQEYNPFNESYALLNNADIEVGDNSLINGSIWDDDEEDFTTF